MEQCPSWANSHSDNQEISSLLWNPKVHYRVTAAYNAYGFGSLEHWGRGFKYRLRHGCMSAVFCCALLCR